MEQRITYHIEPQEDGCYIFTATFNAHDGRTISCTYKPKEVACHWTEMFVQFAKATQTLTIIKSG